MGQESGVFRSLGLSEEMLFAVNAKFMVVRCKKAGYGGFAMDHDFERDHHDHVLSVSGIRKIEELLVAFM
ncbi:hypothetical protein E8E14_004147 [Neopestalotiopsis sp. 37M]|nr:hypothetical protein E8E14_004147 [Neopestalotiopsis sp. 37M]